MLISTNLENDFRRVVQDHRMLQGVRIGGVIYGRDHSEEQNRREPRFKWISIENEVGYFDIVNVI